MRYCNVMSDRALIKRVISGIFSLVVVSCLSVNIASAAGDASMSPGGGAPSSGLGGNGSTWGKEQFLRINIQWVPKDTVGEIEDKKYGLDWSGDSGEIINCGTFDWAAEGYGPLYKVTRHTGFKAVQLHNKEKYSHNGDKAWDNSKSYYTTNAGDFSAVSQSFLLPKSNPLYTKFPIPVTSSSGTSFNKDAKGFFLSGNVEHDLKIADNLAWMAKRTQGIAADGLKDDAKGFAAVKGYHFYDGIMLDDISNKPKYGGYVVTVEPGVYINMASGKGESGGYTAVTARDIYVNSKAGVMSNILSNAATPVKNVILSLSLEPETKFDKLGLEYKTPYTLNQITRPGGSGKDGRTIDGVLRNNGKSEETWDTIKKTMGVGTIVYTSKQKQLPAIHYYYDLTESEIQNVGMKVENGKISTEGLDWTTTGARNVYNGLFNRKANNAKQVQVNGNSYVAPYTEGGYKLIEGYVTNKVVTKGYLKIDGMGLGFFDQSGLRAITPELERHTNRTGLTQEEIKTWATSIKLAVPTAVNKRYTKMVLKDKEEHIVNGAKGLEMRYGSSIGELQPVFLYVREGLVPPPPPNSPTETDDIVPIKTPTHVTKMYYDGEDSKTPTNIEVTEIGKDSVYEVKGEDRGYKLKEWVIVDDKNGGIPGGWADYDTAKKDKTKAEQPGEGTTAGTLGAQHWSNPDRELVIKYERKEEEESEPSNSKLYLSEKRVSWLKNLKNIDGLPQLKFNWKAVTGVEYHGKGKNKKICKESIDDGGLYFVTSNTSGVKSDIMGNVTYFKPYDSKNTYKFTRGNAAGNKTLTPNYHWVIWRGKDKPTIAEYKYDGSTLGNTITDKKPYDIAKNLLNSGKVPVDPRHPNNSCEGKSGFYMDSISIVMGSVNRDTGLNGTGIVPQYNDADWEYTTKWTCGKRSTYSVSKSNTKDYNADVRVDVGYGKPNKGADKVDFKSKNLNAFGIDFEHVKGFPVNNTTAIKAYPYVEMLFDTTMGLQEQKIMTLAGHESEFIPNDYIEIGYKTYYAGGDNKTGLLLQSKQWSVHERSKKLGAKNTVLPGGAVYRLITPSGGKAGNTRTKVGMSSWLTFLPNDTIKAVTAGADKYNGDAQNKRNEELYKQVLNSFNNLDIVQIVNGEQVLQERAGSQVIKGTSGKPTSRDKKYWLEQNLIDGAGKGKPVSIDEAIKVRSPKPNEADLDITDTKEERIYYRIYSDIEGNVYLSKGSSADGTMPGKGQILGQISKGEKADALIAKNKEIKALNNRTKLVDNYINMIDRNMGNDRSGYGKWYNEAFDGICVVRVNKMMEIGFKDGDMSNAARVSAIDPKLCKPIADQSKLFTTKSKSWFETDVHTNISDERGYVGTYTGADNQEVKIDIADMNGLYRSKDFYIPNGTVMNLH